MTVLPQIHRLPLWFVPMVVLVVGFRFYAQYHGLKKGHGIVLSLLAIAVLILLMYSQGFGVTREVSVSILITMTVLKLLETYHKRDAYLVVMLCYFVIMTRFLYSQDLMLLVYLFVAVWSSSNALHVLQFQKNEILFDRQQLIQTAKLVSLGVPFAVIFFIFFPRLGSPIWGSPDIFGEGKTGISDSMSPGSIVELFMDDSPALRVTFKNGVIPDPRHLYWRGPVLWHYDGTTWTRKKSRVRAPIESFRSEQVVDYQVEQESTGQNYMFSLDYVLGQPNSAFMLEDSTLYSPTKINQLKHYELQSVLLDSFSEQLSEQDRKFLLSYPEQLNPKTQLMMASWLSDDQSNSAEALINRTLTYFNQSDFFYSYSPPSLHGDIVDQFLFETKLGFCEHYASTFVLMMRMAGIPARVVTGYQGGIDRGEYLLIKQSDAHAWAEVFIETEPGIGSWRRVDPTAVVSPERVRTGAGSIIQTPRNWYDFEWIRQTREGIDQWRYQWNRWIRNFNLSKQNAFFEMMGFKHHEVTKIALIMAFLIFLLSGVMALWLWIKARPLKTAYQKIYVSYVKLLFPHKECQQALNNGFKYNQQYLQSIYPELKPLLIRFESLYLKGRFAHHQQPDQAYISQLKNLLFKIKKRKSLK